MGVGTLLSLDEYLRTSFHPDCDFVGGEVLERNVGKRKHSYAQGEIEFWFRQRRDVQRLHPLPELRVQVTGDRVRIPDIAVADVPIPEAEVFTAPPYLCVEIMSPDDTMSSMQDRIDDYLRFGVPNLWVVDPWKHRGWNLTSDGRVAMPLADVLLP